MLICQDPDERVDELPIDDMDDEPIIVNEARYTTLLQTLMHLSISQVLPLPACIEIKDCY